MTAVIGVTGLMWTGCGDDGSSSDGPDATNDGSALADASGTDTSTDAPQNTPAGILEPRRAIDWSKAGVPNGIPSRTTVCYTVATSDDADAIQGHINTCPQDQVVFFPTGTWTLNHSLTCNKGIVLRGNGPTHTKLIMNGGNGNIFFGPGSPGAGGQGGYPPGPYGADSWTGGLTQGSTVLTLTSAAGLIVGQTVLLDQRNDTNIVFPIGTEGTQAGGADELDPPGFTTAPGTRLQMQLVTILSCDGSSTTGHACTGNQVTVDPPVDYTHDAALLPRVMYYTGGGNYLQYGGVENMKIDVQAKYNRAIAFTFCSYCWVKNVEIDNSARGAVFFWFSNRGEIRDSYINQAPTAPGPTQYGFEIAESTLIKIENNIAYNETSAFMPMGDEGLVAGYNFTENVYPGNQFAAFEPHQSHSDFHLYEGNVTYMFNVDNVWGSASQLTFFRNRFSGLAPNKTNYRTPLLFGAHQRYMNVVGNILGTVGYHDKYEENFATRGSTNDPDTFAYSVGFWNSWNWPDPYPMCTVTPDKVNCVHDDVVGSSLMRWGNWDAVTYAANGNANGVRWCTGSAAGNPACTADERAEADPTLPGLSAPNQTLPASFYLPSKPSWFGTVDWPPIGPDVTCSANCMANVANHAAKIPAQLCYESGAKDGNGYLTAFDATACYGP